MKIRYIIGNKDIELTVNGTSFYGEDINLLEKDTNLLKNTQWDEAGYLVNEIIDSAQFVKIKDGLEKKIKLLLEEHLQSSLDQFALEKYHHFVSDTTHDSFVQSFNLGWHINEFPIDFKILVTRISNLLNQSLTPLAKHVNIQDPSIYSYFKKNNIDSPEMFNVRIVRPQKFTDNNPPHKDVYIDRLRDAINIYLPLCGSTKQSSLPLIPNSHKLKESLIERTSKDTLINSRKYSVSSVLRVNNEFLKLQRPNPKLGEAIIFSPYLIHGGAYNFLENETRVSVEFRLWKKN